MCRCQAGRSYAIVARGTITANTCMIKYRWYKGASGHMADIAIFTGWHMRWIGLRNLAGCIATIVAGLTLFTHNVGSVMVDKCIEEISCVMAYDAITVRVAMNCCIRRSSGTDCNIICAAIVARSTVIGDTRVCKDRGNE